MDTPAHLADTSCFVCGHTETEHPATDHHTFWSNADARAEAERYDARTHHRWSNGATTPEAAYIAEHRPY